MTDPAPYRRRPPRRRSHGLVAVGAVVVLAAMLAVGVAIGESLNDNPVPGGTQGYVRTLDPQPLPPAAETTVTVTVTTSS